MKINYKITTWILLGALISVTAWFCFSYQNKDLGNYAYRMGNMHRMSDGSMMHNGAMNMSAMMADMAAQLDGKTGDAFDRAFLQEMIVHHEGAVLMAQAVLTSSSRPELVALAQDIIKAQTSEIAMMKEWLAIWFR